MTEPIRILRVIARLNVGGPALHVSYLTSRARRRGYQTTLVAGQVGAARARWRRRRASSGSSRATSPGSSATIAAVDGRRGDPRACAVIREFRPHIVHTHTAKAGALGRSRRKLAGSARPQVVVHTFHGHVLRGYFTPVVTRDVPPRRAHARARHRRPDRRQPGGT